MIPILFAFSQASTSPILLDVDATDAPKGVLRVVEKLFASGDFSLSLPQWIPGQHSATGTINDLVSLHMSKAGRELAWRRDPKNLFTFKVDVPPGEENLEVRFTVASAPNDNLTARLGRIKWNRLVLLPRGRIDEITVRASLKAPAGWAVQTALRREPAGSGAQFETVTAERLVDSPVQIGKNAKTVPLGDRYWLDMLADDPQELAIRPETVVAFKGLVTQTQRLFGTRHFDQYRFLTTFSDYGAGSGPGGGTGLEHGESSEDATLGSGLAPDNAADLGHLVSHEMVHSWNGKYRRPQGLVTETFEEAYDSELLWVYEGLTDYYGCVLAARSGFADAAAMREWMAAEVEISDTAAGRAWRPIVDTAVATGLDRLYPGRTWQSDRRWGADYYFEMIPVWMEADATIRRLTKGAKSLDDFCRAFYGGKDTGPEVRPYGLDDVIAGLNAVAPYDWSAFFQSRVYAVHAASPSEGLAAAGWRLAYDATPNEAGGFAFFLTAIGSTFRAGFVSYGGQIRDVTIGSPAYKAGLVPGAVLLTVNGEAFSPMGLNAAITAAKGSKKPIRLKFQHDGVVSVGELDYHGGLLYPHLRRIAGMPDVLSEILRPLK